MVGWAEDLKPASSGGSSVGTSSLLLESAVGAVVATCPDFFYKQKFGGSSRDLQSRESFTCLSSSKCFKFKMHYARCSSSQLFLVESL